MPELRPANVQAAGRRRLWRDVAHAHQEEQRPCYCKFDTEVLSQITVPYRERVETRKQFHDRLDYNSWVWEKVVDVCRLMRRPKGFRFHHKITTDGVAASVLFSRPARKLDGKSKRRRLYQGEEEEAPSSLVGVDPGRRNLITAMDRKGRTSRYTSRQRTFESELTRYREVREREREEEEGHCREGSGGSLDIATGWWTQRPILSIC